MANEKFQNALKRIPQQVPPIWFMRQAGRYHKHYQAIRAKHSFEEMCKNAALAAEVAMGPIEDFDFDLAILFSDILFPLEAMGMGLKYDPAPTLSFQLNEETLPRLRPANEAIEGLRFQKDAVRATRERLPQSKSLIGFVGGPWTLFAYAVEGSHKGELKDAKRLMRIFPKFCDLLIPLMIENIKLQFEGGAEAVMVLDTAAGELAPDLMNEQVDFTIAKLARAFPGRLGYYAKGINSAHLSHEIFKKKGVLGGLGFDHRWDIRESLTRHNIGFVQGNFDQSLLFLPPAEFKLRATQYLERVKKLSIEDRAGWVAGVGHGLVPFTPEENVRDLVRLTREVLSN